MRVGWCPDGLMSLLGLGKPWSANSGVVLYSFVEEGLHFPIHRKRWHSYLDGFQFYSFLIHVPWMLASSTAGPYGNLVQDGVSFNKMNSSTMVISILIPCRQYCRPRQSTAWAHFRAPVQWWETVSSTPPNLRAAHGDQCQKRPIRPLSKNFENEGVFTSF